MVLNPAVLRSVAECCLSELGSLPAPEFATLVPGEAWTVGRFVAHLAEGLLWYAVDLRAGITELAALRLRVPADAPPAELLRAVRTHAAVLSAVLDDAPAGLRCWQPEGVVDRDGLLAIACDELLVHTFDAARGCGREFVPPGELAAVPLRRLFPWAAAGADPWAALLVENGRAAGGVPGRPGWRWHSAPLAEWDGTGPGEGAPMVSSR